MLSDDELVEQILLGNENAAEELIKRYYTSILRYCRWHCSNLEKAEDLTQETFLKLFKNLSGYKGKKKFKAYLYTIANHLCIDESRKVEFYPLEDEENIVHEYNDIVRLEDRAEISYFLNFLSSEQREAVILRFGEQLSFGEIAKVMGCNMRTAQSRVRNALKIMRKEQKMKDKNLKGYLQQSLGEEVQPKRLEETIKLCTEIVREQEVTRAEPRTGFFHYLSDVFRFEGIPIFGLQAVTLFIVCLTIASIADVPKNIPIFMPLFVLAIIPAIFKSQYYGMSEIEAVTRASGAQITLAKLVLAGAANLVCITILLCMEVYLQNSYKEIGQIVLYCLVPYLVCMVALLRLIRLQKKQSLQICAIVMLGSCICWGMSARILPWLYETSAVGVWIVTFLIFAMFFINEIHYIAEMRKEGKMYGIVA